MLYNDYQLFDRLTKRSNLQDKSFHVDLCEEVLPPMITVEKLDPDFSNGFHVDSIVGLEVGALLVVYDKKELEIMRVRAISTIENERFLLFDRGFGDSPVSELAVGDQLIVIGWSEPKDLYPLIETRIIKNA